MYHDNLVHLDQIVLKVTQACNLNCTYCYVYNRGDSSWLTRPPLIGDHVIQQLARRIVEHCTDYDLDSFTVEIHGGEPLLIGHGRMRAIFEHLRSRVRIKCLRIVLQTNGLLLDDAWLALFSEFDVSFGISLDGPPEIADRRRLTHAGSGSTGLLLKVVDKLRHNEAFERLFGGCLCVVDPQYSAKSLIDWFVDHQFGSFDFLLPDGSICNPPHAWRGTGPYSRFLIDGFEYWYSMGARAPQIRKFELMLRGLLGERVPLDSLGGDLRRLCVVESDGSIGVSDVARLCGGDFATDKIDVFHHRLDAHSSEYDIARIQEPCAQCKQCPYFRGCGGGHLPHRFDGRGFDNPSLYCDALFTLSERMMCHLREDLPSTAFVSDDGEGQ